MTDIKRPEGAGTPAGLAIQDGTMHKYNQILHILQSISLRISDYKLFIVLQIYKSNGGK